MNTMRNQFGMILLLALAATLPVWAAPADQNQDFFWEMNEPGSGTTIYHAGGSYMGIDTQDITGDRVSQLKLKEERGVEVMMVDQDAPAGKAGVKEHDVILEFNGTRVEGCEQLRRLIHEIPSGRTVTVGISRDGQPLSLQVQLADREKAVNIKSFAMPNISVTPRVTIMPEIDIPAFDISVHNVRSGLQIENLTPQLGEFFGVKGGDGVLVRSVDKGSSAESAGLKAGDVIVRIGDEKVANRTDWNMAMRSHREGKVTLGVVRDKREQNLILTMPERIRDHSQFWAPDGDLKFGDLNIDFDSNDLDELKAASRESATKLHEEIRKEYAQNRDSLLKAKEEFDRQMKPEIEKMRRSLEEMRRELRKTLHEL